MSRNCRSGSQGPGEDPGRSTVVCVTVCVLDYTTCVRAGVLITVFTQVLLRFRCVCAKCLCPPMPLRSVLFRSHYFTAPSPICLSEMGMCGVTFPPGFMCFCVFVFVPSMSVYLQRSLCFLFPIFWDSKSHKCGLGSGPGFPSVQSSVYNVALKQRLLAHIIAFIFKSTCAYKQPSRSGVLK